MDLTRQQAWPIPADHADEELLLELERSEGQSLFGFLRRLGLSDSEAQDVAQEVFYRLWRHLGSGGPITNAKGWAYQTGYRLAMDQHRLRRRAGALATRLGRDTVGARDEDDRIALWAEVDRLPPRQREVLYLRYRSDLPFDVIGDVLGITSSAARSHATQAMATLRRRFPVEGEA